VLRSYDEHKETSIPWTNRVPKSWLIQRGKSIFQNKKQLNTQKQCDNILSLTLKGVVNNSIDNPIGLVPKDYATYQIFEKDDLVFKLIDLENYQTSRVGLVHELGIMSPAYIRIALRKKDDFNIKYFFYQYYDLYLRRVFNQIGAGVRSTLSAKELLNIEILIPPREEQDQIVRFLDWKLAKINKLIRSKKKQIALLNEQRQVIIHNAVTKGVDPNVMMKDSGIEWIGQVPSHWKIYRNKNIFTLRKETVGESSKDYTLLSLTTNGIIPRDIESGKGKFPSDFSTYQKVYSGDFVFCLFDIDETPRTVGLSSYEGMITGAYTVMNPKNADSLFIYYYYLSLDNKKALKPLYTGLRKVINTDVFLRSKIALPDINEQKQIVNYIENKINSINKAMYVIHSEISLLTEYRIRLISDVVTGKVDVRDIEIPEYEADSDETIDDEIDDNLVLDEEDGEMEVE
jgi:type I restriction enzyme S subunit